MPALPPPAVPDGDAIRRTAVLLRRASYPLLFAGGGRGPGREPTTCCWSWRRRCGAPVLASISGKGAIPDSSLWSAGCTWRTSSGPTDGYPEAWRQADAGLVVGSRLTGMSTRAWRLPLPERLAHLDIDPAEMGKSYPVEERLVGDARVGLQALLDEIRRLGGRGRAGGTAPRSGPPATRTTPPARRSAPKPWPSCAALRAGLPEEGILVCDQAIACYWAVRHYQVTAPRRFLYPAGSAALGFGLPVGIGAQVAAPDARSASWPATAGSSSPAPSWPPPCSTTCPWPSSSATTTPTG